jgi:hypothetical protein
LQLGAEAAKFHAVVKLNPSEPYGNKRLEKGTGKGINGLSMRDAFSARSRNTKPETHHMQSWTKRFSLSIAGG